MDAETESKLRDLRCELAEICLDARLEKIAALSNATLGDALATVYNCGLRHLPMTKIDQAVAERCHRMLTVEHDPVRKACAFLALSLFSFSYRIDRAFDLEDVPTEITATMVRALLGLPQFFENKEDRKQALIHLTTSMQEIHKTARTSDEFDFRDAILNGFLDGFSLTPVYGEDVNIKEIATMRADLIRLHLDISGIAQDIVPVWPDEMPDQLRLGILSPGAQSEMAAIRGHISGINRERFHITAFVPDTAIDSVSRGVADIVDVLIPLPVGDTAGSAQMVIHENLDILIGAANITNISTFPWTLLMAQRLARLQVSMHTSPLTTGFDTVDIYINGSLNEGPSAQEEYVEDLILIEGSSNHYLFVDGLPQGQDIQRHELEIPETAPILVSGANIFKIGPDLIETWVDIASALPDAHFVLYPFNPNWATKYPQRTSFLTYVRSCFAAADVEPSRLHVLEAQTSRIPILGLLRLSDVYLDSFPYSGAVSIVEPLLCGCPPVVLEGTTARCRQSSAVLKEIGLDVLVTESREDYISVVVRLLQDEALRTEMSQAVKEVATRAGLGQSDSIGHHIGDALWKAFEERLGATF